MLYLDFFLSGLFVQRVDFVITPLCNLNPETQVSTKSISRVSSRILRPRPIHLDHVHVVAHVAGHQSYDVKIPTTEGRAAEAAVQLANTDGRRPVACRSLPTLGGGVCQLLRLVESRVESVFEEYKKASCYY